eukprot:CAMPEP_0174251310 /NCGR_PEP_ID=MMETSP0439-20130205/1170_1 /TAXON_ID=0 /ORGANISM="Stereomyxa ramosa, Strain Chinc5" /LENGTH=76 /DNA_ID=CAMNT_0015331585 /DNA_START=5 /DNA_END=235 /DNA_ORIENTATION=+
MTSNLKNKFEQLAEPKPPPELYRPGKKPKPVGQREWTPTSQTDTIGAHSTGGYRQNVGGKASSGVPPPKKSLADLP